MPDTVQGTTGTIIGAFGRRMKVVPGGTNESVNARVKGRQLQPVCGDVVRLEPLAGEAEWLITAIEPRRNELDRLSGRGSREILAANIDTVIVMAAAAPRPDWFVVDRYVVAAESMPAQAVIAFNKADIAARDRANAENLDAYRNAGYPVVVCSAASGAGIGDLMQAIGTNKAIIVGQSGVGKSSTINCLLSSDRLATGNLSRSSKEGRHTTVNSVMLALPGGGRIIDSPGVRDYAPYLESESDVAGGFREISSFGAGCRFANCRHLDEPDCAVKAALESRELFDRRYVSYRRLINSVRSRNSDR